MTLSIFPYQAVPRKHWLAISVSPASQTGIDVWGHTDATSILKMGWWIQREGTFAPSTSSSSWQQIASRSNWSDAGVARQEFNSLKENKNRDMYLVSRTQAEWLMMDSFFGRRGIKLNTCSSQACLKKKFCLCDAFVFCFATNWFLSISQEACALTKQCLFLSHLSHW